MKLLGREMTRDNRRTEMNIAVTIVGGIVLAYAVVWFLAWRIQVYRAWRRWERGADMLASTYWYKRTTPTEED